MSRSVSAWRLSGAVFCLAWLGAGCAETGTQVVSKADGGRAASGQRLLVVSQLAWVDAAWAEAFEKALLAELQKTGSASAIQTRSPLALQADKVRYAAQIAEFKPDVVLVIEPGDGTVDQRGRSMLRRFEAGMFRHYAERARRELTWRATVTLEPAGTYILPADMPALARDLVARLQADGILPKPKRGTAAPFPRPIVGKPTV
jgi:hypothetical protein